MAGLHHKITLVNETRSDFLSIDGQRKTRQSVGNSYVSGKPRRFPILCTKHLSVILYTFECEA
jgi:hypothetical protein